MSALLTSPTTICVFLLTYLLHSTLAVVLIGIVARRLRRSANPELRVLMWKTALLLPLVTTLAATVLNLPHFGLQIPLARVSPAVQSEHNRGSDAIPLHMTGSHFELPSMTGDPSLRRDEATSSQLDPSVSATAMFVPSTPQSSSARGWIIIVATWLVSTLIGLAGLSVQVWRLSRLRDQASVVTAPDICDSLSRLKQRLNVGRRVDLLQSADSQGPMTAGILRPFIMIPADVCWSSTTVGQTDGCAHTGIEGQPSVAERDALLAHELVHVARRDALWNLTIQLIGRVFPFQPLNWLAGRQLRQEMDFVADSQAARTLGERSGMAVCLLRLGDRFAGQRSNVAVSSGLAACMASFQSTLGQRIEVLLNEQNDLRPST
ncbi:MAG: M56 family metallopeptidase, partial [Planctomycetota bacterium]|nr:M56 family metallopeptidase [Planctomycetota bacterium]